MNFLKKCLTLLAACQLCCGQGFPFIVYDNTVTTGWQELKTLAISIATGKMRCDRVPTINPWKSWDTETYRCPYSSTKPFKPTFLNQRKRFATSNTANAKANGTGVCGANINSIYIEGIVGKYRVIASNGLPDHEYMDQKTPNIPCEVYNVMLAPVIRTKGFAKHSLSMGTVGLAKSGAILFNARSDEPVCDAAYLAEATTFGSCNGHSNAYANWHYHGPSPCLKASSSVVSATKDTCPIIGYFADGNPIRSECPGRRSCYKLIKDVVYNCSVYYYNRPRPVPVYKGCDSADYVWTPGTDCQLDEANGYEEEDGYTYYLSTEYPFISAKLTGVEGHICGVEV